MRTRAHLSLASVIAIVASTVVVLPARPALAQTYTLGVDVSHWQEENGNVINWQKVADSGHVFAWHKATEGVGYFDPEYADNRVEAGSVGIAFGAYHFARPSGGTIEAAQADASAEAQHFVEVAQPASGDLLPVLDLEAHGDLPVRRLKAWTRAWLEAVRLALGVEPVIYTGPNFWTTRMNDTIDFVDFPLWIAHYTSETSPRTPAANWGGNGWAFWQFTSSGKVPGIQTNADVNRFSGSDLNQYKIPGAPLPEPTPDPATPPVNESPPTISGEAEVGSTLTAAPGTWGGSTPQSYTYEWQRCDSNGLGCVGVEQGTGQTYVVKPADFGHRIKVSVTATNSAASTEAESAPSEIVTDTVAPSRPQMTKPSSRQTLDLSIDASWATSEAGVDAYDVRYRSSSKRSGFGDHVVLLSDTTETSTTLDASTGSTYCFSARAIDQAGNRSRWSVERCTAIPLDDRDLRASASFIRRAGGAFYLDTVTTARRTSSVLSTRVRAREIYVVAQKCPGCGRVAVLFEGRRVATIRLGASTTRNQRLIRAVSFSSPRKGRIQLKVVSSGAPVKIDGLLLALRG
jgi:lysozyme